MFRLAVAASIVACCLASLLEWHNFRTFQTQFNKHYETDEENIRFEIYSRNLEIIRTHNNEADQGLHTYRLGVNEYADMTNEEFQRVMLGFRYDPNTPVQDDIFKASVNADDLPDTVDWRTKGYVTPVKNQGQCGSCWAFSTTGSLEGQHFKATGKLVSLSEQNLVDCSKKEGNMGCMGGLMDQGFRYIKKNHGIDTEASYPYKGKNEKCRFKKVDVGANLTSFKDIKKGDEKALQQAVAEIGPISVAIDAGHPSFQLYKSGVYSERKCSSKKLDHGVLAVGYGTESGAEYWLVKNSWGPSWGQEGYIMMSRNKDNQCGIATQASYPIVAKRGQ